MNNNFDFYVGTYTNENSEGIYLYSINSEGVLKNNGLVAKTDNPSFMAKSKDKKYLLVVNEKGGLSQGTIESYAIINHSLVFINRESSGGQFPCFVTASTKGEVLTANYGDGTIGLLQLKHNGELSELLDVKQHSGHGSTERQKSPHAHSVWFDKYEKEVIAIDLGTNDLWFSKIDFINKKLIDSKQQKLAMPVGSGPRHLSAHPNGKWFYIINELSSSITLVVKSDSGRYSIDKSISTLPEKYNNSNICADIHISSNCNFMYASNRGHDSIVIYKVDPNNGRLTIIGHESTCGVGPRNFAFTPDERFLIVANQKTNSIVSFKRNTSNGLLSYIDKITAPTPVCILF